LTWCGEFTVPFIQSCRACWFDQTFYHRGGEASSSRLWKF